MSAVRMLSPVKQSDVDIAGGFWKKPLKTNREVTLSIEHQQMKATGRIDAFKLDWKPGKPNKPHIFWDSDVAKWIEAAAYSIAKHPDPKLEKQLDNVIALIAAAQQKDGYLNTYFTVIEPDKRWSNLHSTHELYCAGHLIEAAVAYFESTGKRDFLDVMCRYADYIDTVFGRGRGKKRGYPGHPEIELALVRLYLAADNPKYLKLAKYFVDERGQEPHYFVKEAKELGQHRQGQNTQDYDECQAHIPVRQQKTADGHAVRACYLYTGMAGVAAHTNDRELLNACRSIWKNITERRMYVHGGVGSNKNDERFTMDYDLPNDEAYAETCAAISLLFFANQMLQITPHRKYSDVIERALYNGIMSGVSQDGTRFFYSNYLASVPGRHRFTRQRSPERQEWFGCACCPPNIARLLASLGGYIYSQTNSSVFVHLFIDSRCKITIGRRAVELVQKTDYPWDEHVRIEVSPEKPAKFALAVRIPGWCRNAQAKVNGKAVKISAASRSGYLQINRRWSKGDTITLRFPMPVERIEAHPSAGADCGRIALQCGPILYCLEQKDNGNSLSDISIPANSRLQIRKGKSGILKGIPLIHGKAFRRSGKAWKGKLYQPARSRTEPCTITAVPYYLWANRGEGEMVVWIREGR